MYILLYLIPFAVLIASLGVIGIFWSVKNNQFEDFDGAAHRILTSNDETD